MEKTVETAFFEAFERLADKCIAYIAKKGLAMQRPEFQHPYEITMRPLPYYNSNIQELTEAIAKDFVKYKETYKQAAVSKEIESNIDGLKVDGGELERYIISLLTPFKKICSVVHPTGHKIKETAAKSGCNWEHLESGQQVLMEAVENSRYSMLSTIVERKKYYELPYIYKHIEKGTFEYLLRSMLIDMRNYANFLYAVLIQREIDLKDLQEQTGIFLKKNYTASEIAPYIGNTTIAQYYIDKLPTTTLNDKQNPNAKQPNDEQPTIKTIPLTAQQDIMTDRAKKYFEKAIEAGYMEKMGSGYKWTFPISRGAKAALSFFIMMVYNPDNCKQIPFKALERLFDVGRLDSAYSAMLTVKKPQEWRGMIETLFND